jgi:hypothetical protein
MVRGRAMSGGGRWPGRVLALLLLAGCSVGAGEGTVSGELFLPVCGYPGLDNPLEDGTPYSVPIRFLFGDAVGDRIDIRLQNAGGFIDSADGLAIHVRNRHDVVARIRETGSATLSIAPDFPELPATGPDLVASMNLYFNFSCPDSYVNLRAQGGTITFTSMFARTADGDPLDADGVEATFEGVRFEDRRVEVSAAGMYPWAELSGVFEFSYTRGRPAQPFP